MANKQAIIQDLMPMFLNSIKYGIFNIGPPQRINACRAAINLQLIRPQINPAAPINEQPESVSEISPIIYIV